MKLDLIALIVGLLACLTGALTLLASFTPINRPALAVVAPCLLIGIGVVTLILAVRHHKP